MSNQVRKFRGGPPPKKTKKGESAMSTIYRVAKDQVARAVRNRYPSNPGGMAKLGRDVSMLMSIINTEDKHVDTLSTSIAIGNTLPNVYALSAVAQGTTQNTRIGNSLKVNRIDLNLMVNYGDGTPATIAYGDQAVRWFLVKYLKTQSPSAFGISEFLNQDAFGNYTTMSFPNSDTNENFVILAEGEVEIKPGKVGAIAETFTRQVSISRECSFHQEYTAAASSSIVDNMVFVVLVARNPNNTGGSTSVNVAARMWFIDN